MGRHMKTIPRIFVGAGSDFFVVSYASYDF